MTVRDASESVERCVLYSGTPWERWTTALERVRALECQVEGVILSPETTCPDDREEAVFANCGLGLEE